MHFLPYAELLPAHRHPFFRPVHHRRVAQPLPPDPHKTIRNQSTVNPKLKSEANFKFLIGKIS